MTLDFNGGEYVETDGFTGQIVGATATMTITYDELYGILPIVHKVGFRFIEWQRVTDGNAIYKEMIVSYTESFTVKAIYEIQTFDLVIDPNGGEYDSQSTTVTISNNYGSTIELMIPTRYGYNFTGFTNASNVGLISYDSENNVYKFTYGDGNTTIVAEWQAKLVRVTYNAGEGTLSGTGFAISNDRKTAQKTYDFNSAFGQMPNCTLDGYRFLGWFTQEQEGWQMSPTSLVSDENDFTLYAQYEK